MWTVVGVEHVIIILKFFAAAIISDVPSWVRKAELKIAKEIEKQQIEEAERDENQQINFLKDKLK